MKNDLPLHELSIADIYNSAENIIYEIPIYQRNYAWQKEEIEALVHDVWDAYAINKEIYYIGTLVTYKREDNKYEVIDGQQRLTTLYLILKALNVTIKNKLTYRAREQSNKTIAQIPNFNHDDLDAGIQRGFADASLAIKEIVGTNNEQQFANYLANNVHIIHYNVPQDVDLNHYFEVMNSRGEQLEKHEIVKAKLMALLDKTERTKFASIWQSCSEMDTYIQLRCPQNKAVFGTNLNEFLYYGQSFDDLPSLSDASINKCSLSDYVKLEADTTNTTTGQENATSRNKVFQPIIDFPNFLLIVLKITRMAKPDFNPSEIILDDKELINAFDKVKPDRNFAKRFCFNLLQAKYLLDNYVVHHSNEDDTTENNPWQLQRWQLEGKSSYPKNLSSDKRQQDKMTQLLSMFEVSFTPRQRKNYLFYCLYHLFSNPHLDDYCHFLSTLADKYFYDIYLNQNLLNEINTPTPGAFDQVIINGKELNTNVSNTSPDFSLFGNGQEKSKGIPLFVFNYIDYRIWENYVVNLSGERLKKESPKRQKFFQQLGCSDFELSVFEQFYFSRTRRSLEHFYPQVSDKNVLNENQKNCLGNFAMIGSAFNSSGSNWSPGTKLSHYLDPSGKVRHVSVASLKFRIMMQMCHDNIEAKRDSSKAWTYEDIAKHQDIIIKLLCNNVEQ